MATHRPDVVATEMISRPPDRLRVSRPSGEQRSWIGLQCVYGDLDCEKLSSTLRAMAVTGADTPVVFEGLCARVTERVKGSTSPGSTSPEPEDEGLQYERAGQCALGHGHYGQESEKRVKRK